MPTSLHSQAPWLSQALPSLVARMGAVPRVMLAGPGSVDRDQSWKRMLKACEKDSKRDKNDEKGKGNQRNLKELMQKYVKDTFPGGREETWNCR